MGKPEHPLHLDHVVLADPRRLRASARRPDAQAGGKNDLRGGFAVRHRGHPGDHEVPQLHVGIGDLDDLEHGGGDKNGVVRGVVEPYTGISREVFGHGECEVEWVVRDVG